MFQHYRHRRGPYALAEPARFPRALKALIWLVVLAVLFFYMGKWAMGLFVGGDQLRKAVVLTVEKGGPVNVSIEGGLMKRTDTSVPLYGGDKVSTGAGGHGTLTFFDGMRVRLEEQSELEIDETIQGTETSFLQLSLTRGSAWVETPALSSFSGAITRIFETPAFTTKVPAGTEGVITENGMMIFAAKGPGLPVTLKGSSTEITVGEGQKFSVPPTMKASDDPYSFRSALEPSAYTLAFVQESKGIVKTATGATTSTSASNGMLTVTNPKNDTTTADSKVTVKGAVNNEVAKVRINGYVVALSNGTFSQEIMIDKPTMEIEIEALDENDTVLTKVQRTVKKTTTATVTVPAITFPAKGGQTYRTLQGEIVLRGTNANDAAGIMVNEYRLQLFTPGKGTWSYLASTRLGNLKQGSNTFNVYALDANGNKSEPVTLTILLEEGPEGVVTAPTPGTSTSSAPTEVTLPNNAPLEPGTLKVTAPTEGTSHTATGSEFVIAGTTSPNTASVWVNGYQLQLYKAGKTTWNYIASTELQTLKKGVNTYRVIARGSDGRILDRVDYTVNY